MWVVYVLYGVTFWLGTAYYMLLKITVDVEKKTTVPLCTEILIYWIISANSMTSSWNGNEGVYFCYRQSNINESIPILQKDQLSHRNCTLWGENLSLRGRNQSIFDKRST